MMRFSANMTNDDQSVKPMEVKLDRATLRRYRDWARHLAQICPHQTVGQTFAVPILGGLHHQNIRP